MFLIEYYILVFININPFMFLITVFIELVEFAPEMTNLEQI